MRFPHRSVRYVSDCLAFDDWMHDWVRLTSPIVIEIAKHFLHLNYGESIISMKLKQNANLLVGSRPEESNLRFLSTKAILISDIWRPTNWNTSEFSVSQFFPLFLHLGCAAGWPRTTVSKEHQLRQDLFSSSGGISFNRMIRPVLNTMEKVKVRVQVELRAVVDVVRSIHLEVIMTVN